MKKPVEFINGPYGERYMIVTNNRGTIFHIKIDAADEDYLKDFDWFVNRGIVYAWFPNYHMTMKNILLRKPVRTV